MRTTAHRFPPGLSRWEQQLAATRFDAPLSNSFAWGFAPSGMTGGGALWVAANRGSTGTRPAEAQEQTKGLRLKTLGRAEIR